MTEFKSDVEAMKALQEAYQKLTAEIGKAIIGQEEVVKNVLIWQKHYLLIVFPMPLVSATIEFSLRQTLCLQILLVLKF